ncbi:ParA family protein [bacterium]|nr:ParA family protein [bacterium]
MVIAVATQKGGTGKTTTSISLASGLVHLYHKKVLLVDIDSQANSSKVLLEDYPNLKSRETICATMLDRNTLPVRESSIPGLDVVPSHILLSNTDVKLTIAMDHRESRLKTELDKIKDQYDYVFIDCPPALGWLTINAFTAADQVLAVIEPGYFELDSIAQLNKTLADIKGLYHPQLQLLGYLFTKADPTVNSRTSLQVLRDTFGDQVFDTIIPRNVALKDASFKRQDIFSFDPDCKGAKAYLRLIEEVFV